MLEHHATLKLWDDSIHLRYTSLLSGVVNGRTVHYIAYTASKGSYPTLRVLSQGTGGSTAKCEYCVIDGHSFGILNKAFTAWKGIKYKRSLIPASFIAGYCLSEGLCLHSEGILEL